MTVGRTDLRLVVAVVAATAAASAGGWFGLVVPQRTDAGTLRARTLVEETELAERFAARDRATAELPFRAADLDRIERALPDRVDVTAVLVDLDRLARANQLGLRSVIPSEKVPEIDSLVSPLILTVDGRFASVTQFLRDVRETAHLHDGRLDGSGQAYSVTDFVLRAPNEATFPTVEATITINAHAFAPVADGAAPSTVSAPSE